MRKKLEEKGNRDKFHTSALLPKCTPQLLLAWWKIPLTSHLVHRYEHLQPGMVGWTSGTVQTGVGLALVITPVCISCSTPCLSHGRQTWVYWRNATVTHREREFGGTFLIHLQYEEQAPHSPPAGLVWGTLSSGLQTGNIPSFWHRQSSTSWMHSTNGKHFHWFSWGNAHISLSISSNPK